ncbi:nucleotidyltransferase domain-containing protein [Candidatus Nomurabacteria bacterium]|nr:nucleotidyltransferase domain-containing protein [Candidatus Nomurabacteria bacterium]MCB9803282.1 nucleotidyltransferase domain-containing protein [Candidatus Nomurabacteria bacterium]
MKENKRINQIVESLKADSSVNSVLLVGSAAKYGEKKANDIDFIIIVDNLESDIYKSLSHLIQKEPYYFSDDVVRYFDNVLQKEVSFCFKGIVEFIDEIKGFTDSESNKVLGSTVFWSTGPNIPEIFFDDIVRSHILFDRNGQIKQFRNFLQKIPEKFKTNLTEQLIKLINHHYKVFEKGNNISKLINYSEMLYSYIRLVNIQNDMYFVGMKHYKDNIESFSKEDKDLIISCINSYQIDTNLIDAILKYANTRKSK